MSQKAHAAGMYASLTHSSAASCLAWVLVIIAMTQSGCKLPEVEQRAVSPEGIPLTGSQPCCPPEEDRGTARPIGNVRLSQYGPAAVCQDEMADKVVPWSATLDCTGSERVLERLIGRRRLGHTPPILGWFGIGRRSEPGRYQIDRTTQSEAKVLARSILYFTVKRSITIDGVRFTDDDVIAYDGETVTKLIDGGDIGTSKLEIDAFAVLAPYQFLVSFASDFEVDEEHLLPGLTGMIRDEDVLVFAATSLGETTRGMFSIYLDGSDIGLGDADIDALTVLESGDLVCSLDRRTKFGKLVAGPSDLLMLTVLQSGVNTQATWTMHRNAKDTYLENQNIDAIDRDHNGQWYVSAERSFVNQGELYDQADVFAFPDRSNDAPRNRNDLINHATVLSIQGTTLDSNDVTAISLPRWEHLAGSNHR